MKRLKCDKISLLVLFNALLFLTILAELALNQGMADLMVDERRLTNQISTWRNPTSYENVTYNGDIVVENGTYTIENMEFHLFGNITVKNNATMRIKNAKVVLARALETVVFSDKARLIADNATIVFQSNTHGWSEIRVNDEASLVITDSKLSGWAYIIAKLNSKVYIKNTSMKGPEPFARNSGVVTEGNATARIQNSTLDAAGVKGQSSMYILKSIIRPIGIRSSGNGTVEIDSSDVLLHLEDNSSLHIWNSTVTSIESHGDSNAWLTSTSVSLVQAYDKSSIWLINSAAKEIKTFGEGKVYVGWQLPVLGTISVPHTWVPILQGALLLIAAIIIIVALVFVNRRWKRRRIKKTR